LGKLGANIRSVLSEVEELRPIIEAGARSVDEAKEIDRSHSLDRLRAFCELDARLDAQIDKKIQRLVMVREFQRQYGRNSTLKLLSHERSAANKETVTQASLRARSKKSRDTNDNWNDNDNDNDNDDQIDPNEYDWPHEYDEAEREKARRGSRPRED
jgi:hypothetical protein